MSDTATIWGKEGGGEAAQLQPHHMADMHMQSQRQGPQPRKSEDIMESTLAFYIKVFEKVLAGYSFFQFFFIAPTS